MQLDSSFLKTFLLVLFAIHSSISQCTNKMCEKKSLSLSTGTKQNVALDGYVFETLNVSIWEECFNVCLRKCQCLSFNFNEVNKTENCELNDASTKLAPDALKAKEGVTYYELGRSYIDEKGVPRQSCSEPACHNFCCETTPCQNGGTCREVCDVRKRRFQCACPAGYTGHRCQIALPPRSCKDFMLFKKVKANGIYDIVREQNISFPVYCDFNSESGFAWTLIQSHSLQNKDVFKKAFYLHDFPINQDAPEWYSYRLSMSRMKSIRNVSTHWRATCNFPSDGVDFRDYLRSSFSKNDLFAVPDADRCALYEVVDIRGNRCTQCTAYSPYSNQYGYHIDSWYSRDPVGCDFDGRPNGGIENEDNFGEYGSINPSFRCSSNTMSTTQYWIGASP